MEALVKLAQAVLVMKLVLLLGVSLGMILAHLAS